MEFERSSKMIRRKGSELTIIETKEKMNQINIGIVRNALSEKKF